MVPPARVVLPIISEGLNGKRLRTYYASTVVGTAVTISLVVVYVIVTSLPLIVDVSVTGQRVVIVS